MSHKHSSRTYDQHEYFEIRRIVAQLWNSGDTKYAKRFLRRCLADHEREDLNLSAFEWGAADFDRILYEKEPQFIY